MITLNRREDGTFVQEWKWGGVAAGAGGDKGGEDCIEEKRGYPVSDSHSRIFQQEKGFKNLGIVEKERNLKNSFVLF